MEKNMNLNKSEEVIFRRDDISGIGTTHTSLLNELITTNERLIANYSEEVVSIPYGRVSQVDIKLEKEGFIGKTISTIFWLI